MTDNLDLSNFSMLDLFSMEVETQADILNENLLALESQLQTSAGKANSQALPHLEALMRSSHSIKGAARIVQIETAVRIAHVMEDCFVAAMDGNIILKPEQIDRLFHGVDFLLKISQVGDAELVNWLGKRQQEADEIISAIATLLQRRKSDTLSPQADLSSQDVQPRAIQIETEAIEEIKTPEYTAEIEENKLLQLSLDEIFPEEESELISGNLSGKLPRELMSGNLSGKLPREFMSGNLSGKLSSDNNQFSNFTQEAIAQQAEQEAEICLIQQQSEDINGEDSGIISTSVKTQAIPENLTTTTQSLAQGKDRFVRVSADNLNRLMGLAGESLVEATSLNPLVESLGTLKKSQLELAKLLEKLQSSLIKDQLTQESENYLSAIQQKERECRKILNERLSAIEQFAYRSLNLSDRLYREVIVTHMRPFEEGVQSFPRMVRDLGRQLNKQVKLEIIGKATLVDRDILKKLEAPLTHIIRNAIDHGIESPQERLQKGKSAEGIMRLEATHRFGMLSITVSDDGKGIEIESLRQSIVNKQLVNPEMSKQLTESELMEFLFLPGFSTADQVTEISGRGVGLNIAKTMVQEVGGNLQAVAKPGKGMSFHFQLPLTLSVIRTLLVEISGEPYAFPLSRIEQVIKIPLDQISCVENRQYFTLNGQHIGLVRADQVLELNSLSIQSETLSIVILSDQFNRYGIVVNQLLGEKSLVVRPLDPRLGKIQDISAAALLEDGSPILILDVADLVRTIDKLLTSSQVNQVSRKLEKSWAKMKKRILVVDDSITVREMERKILQNQGYEVDVTVDGMEGWNAVRIGNYDLVISDIDMPRMNGIKLVSQIKKHPQLKSIPVIIVSYKDREEDRLQGLEAGADYYLTKSSFHDDTFVNAVVDLIGQ